MLNCIQFYCCEVKAYYFVTSTQYFRYLERFVRELLCQPLTPHTAHLLLPHLSRSPLPLPTLITTVHSSLITKSLPPSLSLLFATLQLTHNKLGKPLHHTLSPLNSYNCYCCKDKFAIGKLLLLCVLMLTFSLVVTEHYFFKLYYITIAL